jgi:hypothetical protein
MRNETTQNDSGLISLDMDQPVWARFLTVAPRVLVGTREAND